MKQLITIAALTLVSNHAFAAQFASQASVQLFGPDKASISFTGKAAEDLYKLLEKGKHVRKQQAIESSTLTGPDLTCSAGSLLVAGKVNFSFYCYTMVSGNGSFDPNEHIYTLIAVPSHIGPAVVAGGDVRYPTAATVAIYGDAGATLAGFVRQNRTLSTYMPPFRGGAFLTFNSEGEVQTWKALPQAR